MKRFDLISWKPVVIHIPSPYTPEYAPIELAFSQMKTYIKWKETKF